MAPAKSLSGFIFDIEKWRGSKAVQRMSFAEKGVYLEMLIEQWDKRFLPDSAEEVADALSVTEAQRQEVIAAWDVVRRKFVTPTGPPPRIYNAAMERTRRNQAEYRRRHAESGSKGGKAAAAKRAETRELQASNAIAPLQQPYSTAVAIPSTREVSKGREVKGSEGSGGSARSNRVIFSGQKLTVFEWMFDDCCKTLGNLTNDFGLDEWFYELDAEAMRANLIPPKRDGGAWLQSKLIAEARRRGLPLTDAITGERFGKQTTKLMAAVAAIQAREAQR